MRTHTFDFKKAYFTACGQSTFGKEVSLSGKVSCRTCRKRYEKFFSYKDNFNNDIDPEDIF